MVAHRWRHPRCAGNHPATTHNPARGDLKNAGDPSWGRKIRITPIRLLPPRRNAIVRGLPICSTAPIFTARPDRGTNDGIWGRLPSIRFDCCPSRSRYGNRITTAAAGGVIIALDGFRQRDAPSGKGCPSSAATCPPLKLTALIQALAQVLTPPVSWLVQERR
jgi:hypothetical protein